MFKKVNNLKWWESIESNGRNDQIVQQIVNEIRTLDGKENLEAINDVKDEVMTAFPSCEDELLKCKLMHQLSILGNRIGVPAQSPLGMKIKEQRERQGLSLTDVEGMTGINGRFIKRIEEGTRLGAPVTIICKLAEALNIDEALLLEIAGVKVLD